MIVYFWVMYMKKYVIVTAVYNVIFFAMAVVFSIIEDNKVSFPYIMLLLLVSDFFIAYYHRSILKIQHEQVDKIKKNQEMLVEQERLSSLGQLIGGIAHNLKTPIMSIAGALEGLSDLVKEYDESIEDKNVTASDHHEIASDMLVWIGKIKPYLSYMTEVIDAVKGQAVSMNITSDGSFSAKELVLRTQILMKDELNRRHCKLNLDVSLDDEVEISGQLNALVQVLDNLIMNSMDAYGENGGDIGLKIYEDESKMYIEVADNAGGISDGVKDKIFNEMVTSKGKNGTGLGLYMSYSTIKGKFNGDMRFESDNVGTTFFIELNKVKGERVTS